jgi:hypothetical protein
MFELGTMYGIFIIMAYATAVMGIGFILLNKFFRKEYYANFIRYGISIFKLIVEAIVAGFGIYVIIVHFDRLSVNMFFIHLFAAILLLSDVIISIILKVNLYKKSKKASKK